jgi:hypothetical protein
MPGAAAEGGTLTGRSAWNASLTGRLARRRARAYGLRGGALRAP